MNAATVPTMTNPKCHVRNRTNITRCRLRTLCRSSLYAVGLLFMASLCPWPDAVLNALCVASVVICLAGGAVLIALWRKEYVIERAAAPAVQDSIRHPVQESV